MIDNVSQIMTGMITVHHSYDPEIIFLTPTKARAIWAMTGGIVADQTTGSADAATWNANYGYYFESYEKREGTWLFTSRRWHNYFGMGSDGVRLPTHHPRGADAFDDEHFFRKP